MTSYENLGQRIATVTKKLMSTCDVQQHASERPIVENLKKFKKIKINENDSECFHYHYKIEYSYSNLTARRPRFSICFVSSLEFKPI